jgi:hypothetical protein
LQADILEADRDLFRHAKSAAKVEIALRLERRIAQLDAQCRGHGVQRDTRAGHQGLQQHVSRARARSASTGGRMQPRNDERFACLDFATDTVPETPLCTQRDERRLGLLAVALFQRRLDRP